MNDNELYEKYNPDEPYDPAKAYNITFKNYKKKLKKEGETTKEINKQIMEFKLIFLQCFLHIATVCLMEDNVKIIDNNGNEIEKILTLYKENSEPSKKKAKLFPIKYSNFLQLIFKGLSEDGSIPFTLADFCYSPEEIEELFPEESKRKSEKLFSDKRWSDFDILTYNTSIQKLPFGRPSANRSFNSMLTEIYESLFAKKILGTNSSADPIFYAQLPTGKFFDAGFNKNRPPFFVEEDRLIYYDYPVSMIGQLLFQIRRSWYTPLTLILETKNKKTGDITKKEDITTEISLYDTIILFEDFCKSKLNIKESSADFWVKFISEQDNFLLEKIKNNPNILDSISKKNELKKLDLFENATETFPDNSTKADITDDILDFVFNLTKAELSDIEGKDAAEQDILKDSFKDVLSYIADTKTVPERESEYSTEKILNAITTNGFSGARPKPSPLLLKYQHILLLLSYIYKLDNSLRQLAKSSMFKNFISYPYPSDDWTVIIFIAMELHFMEGTQKNMYKYLVQNHIKSEDTSKHYDPDSINEILHPFIKVNRKKFHKNIIELLSIGKTNLDKEAKEKIKREADKLFPPKDDSKLLDNEYSISYSYAKTLNEHCRHCKHIVTPAKDSIETERCSLKLGCLECEHNKHPFNNLLSLLSFK